MGGLRRWLADRFADRTRGPGSSLLPHDLPAIFRHWLEMHVCPMLHPLGVADVDTFFAHHLRDSAVRTGAGAPRFLSLGSGNAATELRIAAAFVADGLTDFTIECVESNPLLQSNARAAALARGLDQHVIGVRADGSSWRARGSYDGVMANGSLDQVVRLERLLDEVRRSLAAGAWFLVNARIGRNGHQRWPEALVEVQRCFAELPASHRWNHQLRRQENVFRDWDTSRIGAHGLRAQDVLPELLRRFSMPVFVGFGNLIDPFVDPAFGPNFSRDAAWDRSFIAAVHERDEALLLRGELLPTRMVAVLSPDGGPVRYHARGLSPEASVRRPGGRSS